MTSLRITGVQALAMLAGALTLLVLATPTARADDELELSADGRTWQGEHSVALFDPSVRWVPGDERTAVAWARNATDEPAELRVEVRDLQGRDLLRSGDLELEFTLDGRTVPTGAETFTVPRTTPGRSVEVGATARFALAAGNDTQGEALAFDLRVTLTGAVPDGTEPPPDEPNDPATDGQDGLGATGAPAGVVALVLVGILAVLGGIAVLARGRSSRPASERKP